MKRLILTLPGVALCLIMMSACGTPSNGADHGIDAHVDAADAGQDAAADLPEDSRPETGTDSGSDVAADHGPDDAGDLPGDADASNDAAGDGSELDTDAGPDEGAPDGDEDGGTDTDDNGGEDAAACESAHVIGNDQPYALEPGSGRDDFSAYSCDTETWDGPESLFSFVPSCDGTTRFTVTPSGDPGSEEYVPVIAFLLGGCSAAECVEALAPGHPVTFTIDTATGRKVFFAVETADPDVSTSPAITVVAHQTCRDCRDVDQDGHYGFNAVLCPSGTDCNDDDSRMYPGHAEVACDGVDQDCSGSDTCNSIVCVDFDNDGFVNRDPVACPMGRDCNDSNASIHPDAQDIACNSIDENCDGIDRCPGTGQHCDSCLFTGSCAPDHVCVPMVGDMAGIAADCLKTCAGAFDCPAGSTCIPDVVNNTGVCFADRTASCDGRQLSINDTCGNAVYRATCPAACDAEAMVCAESCAGTVPLSTGTVVAGRMTPGTSSINSYPGFPGTPGSEQVFAFTASCSGVARAVVTEMADMELAVFVMKSNCDNGSVIASGTTGSIIHSTEFAIENGAGYFIAVDSTVQADSGPFTIQIVTECGTVDRQHCEECRFDMQCDSGICNRPGNPAVETGRCLAECPIDGQCPQGSRCAVHSGWYYCVPDATGSCAGNVLSAQDTCGLSWQVETCGQGEQCNAAMMSCTNGCVDDDNDGFDGYDPENCPFGLDCKDDDTTVRPDAIDIRCNGTDEDCSGADNCSDAAQCEACDGGHCAPGYYCWQQPGFEDPGVCLQNCTDNECPNGEFDLTCTSWMSQAGNDEYYCRPDVFRTCDGRTALVTDGCGRTIASTVCDVSCYDDFGCVNNCPAAAVHPGCGQTVHGDTRGAVDRTDYYYNSKNTVDDLTGPETAWSFVPSCTGEFNVVLSNAAKWLTVVVVQSSPGACTTRNLIDYAVFVDEPKIVGFDAIAGSHYTIIVDGMDGAEGEFDLTVNCLCGTGCVDADSDGFIDRHQVDCPSGKDCDGTSAAVHPGATEIQCNEIDEDCSGYDDCRSNTCAVDVEIGTLATAVSGLAGQTAGAGDEMTFYGGVCSDSYPRFNTETVYRFKPACSGVLTVTTTDLLYDQADIYLLEGSCRADLCVKQGWYEMTADVNAGTDYFIVIDGTAPGPNTWKLDASISCI